MYLHAMAMYCTWAPSLKMLTTSDNARIHEIFEYLISKSAVARLILGRISYDQCGYYKLENPVANLPLPCGAFDRDQIVQIYPDQSKLERVLPEYTFQRRY